jgi:hypothetical protein
MYYKLIHARMHLCVCMYVYMQNDNRMHACMYVCMYVCTYVFTFIEKDWDLKTDVPTPYVCLTFVETESALTRSRDEVALKVLLI